MVRCRALVHVYLYMPVAQCSWERLIAVYDAWSQGWVTTPMYPSVRIFTAQCKLLINSLAYHKQSKHNG